LEDFIGCFCLGKDVDDCFEVTVGAGYVGFLHVSYHIFLFSFAYFADFAVHEGCSKFVAAAFTDLGS
jgi:hypothetical protein